MLSSVEPMSAETAAAITWWYDLGASASDLVLAARGEQGRIWRLETSQGSWAVKELLFPMEEQQAARDMEFQLAARSAGIPLPLPRRTRDDRVVLPVGQAASAWDIRVYQWADLAPDQVVTAAEVGAVTARLHQMEHDAEPRPVEAWFSEPLGEQAWVALLDDARRAGAPWEEPLGRWLPELITLDEAVSPPDPARTRTCHRDLNIENIRCSADSGVVVLDWENCGPAEPAWELATVICDLAADVSTDAARDGYAAYLAAGGPARLGSLADFAMAAAAQGHLLQFYSRRALGAGESAENHARSAKRLHDMLSQPLTMTWAGYLLDLCGSSP
jgi:Ser/Thr protein kinase RdoA (MazF antagonist)